jgi:hypothetical protein
MKHVSKLSSAERRKLMQFNFTGGPVEDPEATGDLPFTAFGFAAMAWARGVNGSRLPIQPLALLGIFGARCGRRSDMPARKRRRAQLVLSIQLVPARLSKKNLWSPSALGKYGWRKLRRRLLAGRSLKCESCGSRAEKLDAHERWAYQTSESPAVAKLKGITFLCGKCHGCVHFGRTVIMVREGYLTWDQVEETIKHYCRVNRVKRHDFERHLESAIKRRDRLSKLQWTVEYGPFSALVAERLARQNARATKEPVKLRLNPATDSEFVEPSPSPKRGRRPLFGRAMTPAEQTKRCRYLKKAGITNDLFNETNRSDSVYATVARIVAPAPSS